MEFDAILFDMDGTLNESGEGIMRSVVYACEQKGLEVPGEAVLRTFVGPPLLDSFMRVFSLNREQGLKAIEAYRSRYNETGWRENRLYPGIAQLLRTLKKKGAYLGIASGKPLVFVKRILEYFGIDDCFEIVLGITGEERAETKQELIHRAIPEGCPPERVCMIGDRDSDMTSAKAEGVTAIGALWGYGSEKELTDAGADRIAKDAWDLYSMLLPGEKKPRGRFITFEGADGCGKSTQLKLLNGYLAERGYDTVCSREPGGCPISESIREVLLQIGNTGMSGECEALLFAASRAEHVKSVILPALEDGKIVLCDRYLDSSIAYQAHARELGEAFIRQINSPAMAAVPDRTLLFVGDRETVSARLRSHGNLDRIETEKDSFVMRIYDAYEDIAAAEPQRVHRIDSDRTIEEIFADVRKDIAELLK